ncbi:hypothetical protein EGW08_020242 [Elysia chlorotica]|uniref:Spaetzle domain-containing protein n=1 Tax=Elysia chlorotica TaxID=188477 RepID=A0A433SS00_ELYCH|nr:hypothetical protein EGW08_020242 [Elysia chlorotica]
MSLHITYIPFLYCLLYHRTGSGRARDIFLGSRILTTGWQSAETDSRDELFTQDSSDHHFSSRLDSGEEREWAHEPDSKGYRSNLYMDSTYYPWRDILYQPLYHRQHHRHRNGPRRRMVKRNEKTIRRLCSNVNFRPAGQIRQHRKSYKEASQSDTLPSANKGNAKECSLKNEFDVRQLVPGAFLSHKELEEILPLHKVKMMSHERISGKSQDHSIKLSKMVALPHTHSSLKAETGAPFTCGACFTEIVYDVFHEIRDVNGIVHQVINFNNAFQFIPIGRCKNELSACGGGQGATCRQMYRAHWSFVFSQESGARLVPHEVPSHCECMNIATAAQHQNGDRPRLSVSETGL